ncbi:MAG: transposase, partial [Ignavibacteriae bacterium]|nr:transposase [Ignavibacteriota bacterium]
TEPETVFADMKWNNGFTRFHLRGKEKVNVETGLACLAHNIEATLLNDELRSYMDHIQPHRANDTFWSTPFQEQGKHRRRVATG